MFESHGSAFDSEVWADASVLNGNYDRPPNLYQSATARLGSVDDLDAFKATLEGDPRTTVGGPARAGVLREQVADREHPDHRGSGRSSPS